MKTDLATSIGVAIIGAVIAYFVCDMFIGPLESFSFLTLDPNSNVSASIDDPDAEVFNYKALNPTVEVYVGNDEDNQGGGQ